MSERWGNLGDDSMEFICVTKLEIEVVFLQQSLLVVRHLSALGWSSKRSTVAKSEFLKTIFIKIRKKIEKPENFILYCIK